MAVAHARSHYFELDVKCDNKDLFITELKGGCVQIYVGHLDAEEEEGKGKK